MHNFEVVICYKCRKCCEIEEACFEERMILSDTCLVNVQRRCEAMFGSNIKAYDFATKWTIICLD